MNVPWYEQEDILDRLTVFGRAIQGVDPYQVIIEPDPKKCHSAYCSFDLRRISVNPTIFSVPAAEQYQLTKALLVHEAGHRRHTTPTALPAIVREIANILEDERIERRMWDEFVGIRWLISKLAARFYEETRLIDEASEISHEVVLYFLQLRWAKRVGKPVKGILSKRNQLLWEKVRPLVEESWQAPCSEMVNRNSAKITQILNLSCDNASSSIR